MYLDKKQDCMSLSSRPLSRQMTLSQSDLADNLTRQENRELSQAVFLDRDGTINVERGYLLDPNEVELCPTAGEAIYTLNQLNLLIVVITNQAAMDKGFLSLEQFERINDRLWSELASVKAHYDALYFCPHRLEATAVCHCRKPKPGLLLQAAKDFNIDLPNSFMVGDKLTDIEAGHAVGCRTILLRSSGHGEKAYKQLKNYSGTPPDFVCQNLGEAATWLLQNLIKPA
jgi:D-glycero-D-manno-heptose 1,7-bisphosphate phosphatase